LDDIVENKDNYKLEAKRLKIKIKRSSIFDIYGNFVKKPDFNNVLSEKCVN